LENRKNSRKSPTKFLNLKKIEITGKVGDLHSASPKQINDTQTVMSSSSINTQVNLDLPPHQLRCLRKAHKLRIANDKTLSSLIQRSNDLNSTNAGKHCRTKEAPKLNIENLKSTINTNKVGMPVYKNQIKIAKNKPKKHERLTSFPREGNTYTLK
jgi:hypothetical protein